MTVSYWKFERNPKYWNARIAFLRVQCMHTLLVDRCPRYTSFIYNIYRISRICKKPKIRTEKIQLHCERSSKNRQVVSLIREGRVVVAFTRNGVKSLSFHATPPPSDAATDSLRVSSPTGVVLFFALVSVNWPPPPGSRCIERVYDVIELSVTSRQGLSFSSSRGTAFWKRGIGQAPRVVLYSARRVSNLRQNDLNRFDIKFKIKNLGRWVVVWKFGFWEVKSCEVSDFTDKRLWEELVKIWIG